MSDHTIANPAEPRDETHQTAQPQSKVVPINLNNTTHDRLTSGINKSVIAACRDMFAVKFEHNLMGFFDKVDDELFTLSDKAENSSLQTVYFDAMRLIRREREELERSYLNKLFAHFDDFWHAYKQAETSQSGIQSGEEDAFSLVENEALEEDLAIKTMVDKGNNIYHSELYALNKRFAVLLDISHEIDKDDNPIAPAPVCKTFAEVLEPVDTEIEVKLLVYKIFDKIVLSQLGDIYFALNTTLVRQGILPKISHKVNRSGFNVPFAFHHSAGGAGTGFGDGYTDADVHADNASYIEVFRSLQSYLSGWRSASGILPTLSAPAGGLTNMLAMETEDVLGVLSMIQQTGVLEETLRYENTLQALKANLAEALKNAQPEGESRPISSLDEDIIDMVSITFDFILEDDNLPAPVKAEIARLQIPVVKVAMIEKAFFAKKTHPARQLLNLLAQAGIGLDNDSCNESPVFKEIQKVVNRVLTEFVQDVGLFKELLERFSGFFEKDEHRSQIAENRTRQVTQSKEQVIHAKSTAAFEIASRSQGKELPVEVKVFLDGAWLDVLVLACLRKDKEPNNWNQRLEIVETLLWSVTPTSKPEERKAILRAVPELLKSIRLGLEDLSYDPHQIADILKGLELCHVSVLNSLVHSEADSDEDDNTSSASLRVTKEDKLTDTPETGQIIDLSSSLPDPDDYSADEINAGAEQTEAKNSFATLTETSHSGDESHAIDDEYTECAQDLKVGTWLDFTDDLGKQIRAKLSWKSPVTSLYVFVNRKGMKVSEKMPDELAEALRNGDTSILENVTTPLMDRALEAMMKTLKQPAA